MKMKKNQINKHEKEDIKIKKIIRDAFRQAIEFGKNDIKYSQKFAKFI